MGLTVAEMNLEPDVAQKARQLQAAAPGVVFTSGRRTIEQQAHALAVNTAQSRLYISETYAASPVKAALVLWLHAHDAIRDVAGMAAGFAVVMHRFTDADLAHLSRHLSGRAFDVLPGSCTVEQLDALNPELLLTHEGGLVRYHIQW